MFVLLSGASFGCASVKAKWIVSWLLDAYLTLGALPRHGDQLAGGGPLLGAVLLGREARLQAATAPEEVGPVLGCQSHRVGVGEAERGADVGRDRLLGSPGGDILRLGGHPVVHGRLAVSG